MNVLDEIISKVSTGGTSVIPGEEIFRLYDTFGFPVDFARDMAMDAGLKIDEDAFQREMELQRERSKVNIGSFKVTASMPPIKLYSVVGKTEFVGYDMLTTDAAVRDIFRQGETVDVLSEGEEGEIVLDKTPFYGESGGQVGDTGTMTSGHALIRVTDTKKPNPDIYVHGVKVEKGSIKKGDKVFCAVDEILRKATMRNHTATHLLHKTLRIVLGDHVKQSGSVVDPARLRFDFTHFKAIQDDDIRKIEELINGKIMENLPVKTDIMSLDEATGAGATALFDEKYGETVRVISIGDFSKELCSGTHCKATGEIGLCVILSESSVASGIRRIEALTGKPALDYLKQKESEVEQMRSILKTERPLEKVERLLDEMKSMEKEIQKLKTSSARDVISDALKDAHELSGIKVVRMRQDGLNMNELRLLADNVRNRLKSGIIVVSSVTDSQAAIVCMVTKDLTDRYNAGEIVKSISKIAGGKGGGKPDMAQGGTKDIARLDEALESVYDIIRK
jgi:alanyl-tRNA synthetase